MIRLYVRQRVQDYEAWRRSHDQAETELRPDSGVVGSGVHRSVDDSDDVTVWHDFETEAEARAFAKHSSAREKLGETSQFWITRDVT